MGPPFRVGILAFSLRPVLVVLRSIRNIPAGEPEAFAASEDCLSTGGGGALDNMEGISATWR